LPAQTCGLWSSWRQETPTGFKQCGGEEGHLYRGPKKKVFLLFKKRWGLTGGDRPVEACEMRDPRRTPTGGGERSPTAFFFGNADGKNGGVLGLRGEENMPKKMPVSRRHLWTRQNYPTGRTCNKPMAEKVTPGEKARRRTNPMEKKGHGDKRLGHGSIR